MHNTPLNILHCRELLYQLATHIVHESYRLPWRQFNNDWLSSVQRCKTIGDVVLHALVFDWVLSQKKKAPLPRPVAVRGNRKAGQQAVVAPIDDGKAIY